MKNFLEKDNLLGTVNGTFYRRINRSERDVEIPPAFLITDETGASWSLGTKYIEHNGFYEFNVIRNDVELDEYAQKIVYRKGVVTLFGRDGMRRWTGTCFV